MHNFSFWLPYLEFPDFCHEKLIPMSWTQGSLANVHREWTVSMFPYYLLQDNKHTMLSLISFPPKKAQLANVWSIKKKKSNELIKLWIISTLFSMTP